MFTKLARGAIWVRFIMPNFTVTAYRYSVCRRAVKCGNGFRVDSSRFSETCGIPQKNADSVIFACIAESCQIDVATNSCCVLFQLLACWVFWRIASRCSAGGYMRRNMDGGRRQLSECFWQIHGQYVWYIHLYGKCWYHSHSIRQTVF